MITTKPQPGEYVDYQMNYIKQVGDAPVQQLILDLKDKGYAFYTSIPEEKGNHTYAPGKWTIKEVLGHIIDTERIFGYRLLCFIRGEKQGLPGFDQDDYVALSDANNRTIQDLAEEMKAVRTANAYVVRNITEEQGAIKGTSAGNPISVRTILYIMAGHELHHMQILKEKYL
ncbi:DinB family protein [Chitinophaga sp.]|uniref:DinB family protein n=1 Tax=Chitinophaga sp. TaxID=1869181 RepID=UPI0031DCA3C6